LKLAVCLGLIGLIAGAAAGNAADAITEFINAADGGGLYVIHGREATGVGPGLEWQMFERCEWLRFDLVAATSSNGSERLIPGVGVRVRGGEGAPDLTLGVCWPPSEYGLARIGGLRTYAAPYLGLRIRL